MKIHTVSCLLWLDNGFEVSKSGSEKTSLGVGVGLLRFPKEKMMVFRMRMVALEMKNVCGWERILEWRTSRIW